MFVSLFGFKKAMMSVALGLALMLSSPGASTAAPAHSQVGAAASYPARASRVHVIQMVYSLDRNGPACQRDVVAFWNTLSEGFGEQSDRLVRHDFTGRNPSTGNYWTGPEILNYLSNYQFGENDVVIPFHSGHGSIRDLRECEDTHTLQINGGKIGRGELLKVLRAKKIRALITLTDCCSACPVVIGQADSADAPVLNRQTVTHLFLEVIGEVGITAAENGMLAVARYTGENPGQAGSAFTVGMLRVMYREQTYTNWSDFFAPVREETNRASGGSHRPHAFRLPQAR